MLLALALAMGASSAVAFPGAAVRTDASERLLLELEGAVRADDAGRLRALFDEDVLTRRATEGAEGPWSLLDSRAWRDRYLDKLARRFIDDLEYFVDERAVLSWNVPPHDAAPSIGVVRSRIVIDDAVTDYYLRLWLAPDGDVMRVRDFELEDHVSRGSEQLGYFAEVPNMSTDMTELVEEFSAAANLARDATDARESARALRALLEIEPERDELVMHLPDVHRFFTMEMGFASGEDAIATAAGRELARSRPECPLAHFRLGMLAERAGQFGAAAARYRRYQQLVGPDAGSLERMGACYARIGRVDAAWECWTGALDLTPSYYSALYSMGVHADDARRAEVARLLLQSPFFDEHFESLLREWAAHGACETVEVVSSVVREARPDEANARYYAANCALDRGDVARAMKLADCGVACAPSDEREFYSELRARVAVRTDDPAAAYRASVDPAEAFDLMAEYAVFSQEDADLLETLVVAREADEPHDPWLPYYRAQVHALRGDVDAAEAVLLDCMSGDGPMERTQYSEACWYARLDILFRAGRVRDAYAGTPDEDAYRYLLQRADEEADGDALRALIAVRADRVPADPELDFWLAHARFLDGDHAEAREAILANADRWLHDEGLVWFVEQDLVRGAIRLGLFDEALRHARESTARDGDPYFEFHAHVARRDADAAIDVLTRLVERDYDPWFGYGDPDTATILREDPAFAAFRRLWPPPAR